MAEKVREEEHGVPIAFGTKDKKKKEQLLKVMGEEVREVEHDVPIAFGTKYKKGIEHLSKGEEYDVSIFYDTKDEMEVEQLSQDLAGQGVTCMLIKSDPLHRIRVKDMFDYALKQSRSVLLYITTHYLQKYEVRMIMHEAMSQQKQVIPVYGDITSEEQRKLPLPLRHLKPIDSREDGYLKHLSIRIKGEDIEYDVSIFYDERDEMEVEKLSQDLVGQGVTCMLIESDTLHEIRVKDMFDYALKQSRSVLLYITTHYLQKYEAEWIIHEAMSQQKQVIPVYGDITSEKQRKLPLALRHLKPIDSREDGYLKHLSMRIKGEDIEYDVSIFYDERDEMEVEKLSQDLAGQGVTCMLIESDTLHEIRVKDMLYYALKQSRSVLLYITTHYLQHPFWGYEARMIMHEAMSQQKQVIPVYGDITSEEQRELTLLLRYLIPIDSRKEGFLKHLSMRIKGEEYDVSIFYDKRDEMEVDQLSQDLAGQGVTCMLIESVTLHEIRVKDMFDYALKQSRSVLLYITTHLQQDHLLWLQAEIIMDEAMSQQKEVIPVYRDITRKELRELTFPLTHLKPIDSRKEGFLKHLSRRIKEPLGGTGEKFMEFKYMKFVGHGPSASHSTKLHTDEDVIFQTKPGISSEGKFQGKKLSKGGYSGLHFLQGPRFLYTDSPTIEPPSPGSDMSDTEILNDLSLLFAEVASDDFISGDLSEDAVLSQEDTIKEKGDLELALILSGIYIQKFTMDHHGGYVHLKEVGVTLVVPGGSLPEGTVMEMYLGVSWRPGDSPHLGGKQARTSPIVVIGPHGLTFQKPVYLSFPHCIPHVDDEKTEKKFWTSKTDLLETCKWTTDENDPVVIYSQTRCTAVLWNLCKYTTSSTKRKMLAAAFGLFDRGTDLLRIYVKCISDTPDETKVLESWMTRNHLKGTIVPDGNFDLYICPHSHDDQGDGDQGNGDQGDGDQGNGDQGDGDHDNNVHIVCKDNHDVLVILKDYQGWTLTGEDKKALDYQRMIDDSRPHCAFSLNPESTTSCPKIFTSKILVAQQGLKGRDARLSSVELDVCCPLHEITKVPGTEQLNVQTLHLSHPDSSFIGENRSQVSEPLLQQSVMNSLVSHQTQVGLPAPGTPEPLQQQSVMNPLDNQTQEGLSAVDPSLQQPGLNLSDQPVLQAPQFSSLSSVLAPASEPINQQNEANPIVERPPQLQVLAQHQQFPNHTPQQQCQQQLPDQQALGALFQLYGRSGLHAQVRQTNMETEGQPNVIVQNTCIYLILPGIHQNGDQGLMAAAPPAHVHDLQRYLPFRAKSNLDRIFKIPRVWEVIVRELRLGNDCCPKEPVEFIFCHLEGSFQSLIWLLKTIGETVKEIVEPSEIEVMINEVRKARVHEVECENLRKHLPYIAANGSDIESLLDFLFSKSIINESDMEIIKCQQTSSKKWSLLLHKVLKCPVDKDPVGHLRQWFVDEDRHDIADLLAVKPEDEQESYPPDEALRPDEYQGE